MTFMISIGKWGGFYVFNGWTKRLCLGWIALTFIPRDEGVTVCIEMSGIGNKKDG